MSTTPNGVLAVEKGFGGTRRHFLRGLGAAAAVASLPAKARAAEPSLADTWQGIELEDVSGRRFRVGDTGHTLTLVKLWASWCPACLRELTTLQSLLASSGLPPIDVLLVSHPAYWADDRKAALARRLDFRLATASADNSAEAVQHALTDAAGDFAVPRSLLFKKSAAEAVWTHRGPMRWTSPGDLAELKTRIG